MASSVSTNTKINQGPNESQPVSDGPDPMNKNTKQVHNQYSGDTSDDESEAKVYESHGKIIRTWFEGDTNKESEYWDMRLRKYEGGRTLIHRAISEINRKMAKKTQKPQKLFNPDKAIELIETIVLEQPGLFTAHIGDIKPAMFEAARSQTSILFKVLGLLIPVSTVEKLKNNKNECEKDNSKCPLLDVAEGRRNQCLKSNDSGTADSPKNADLLEATNLKNAREKAPTTDKNSVNPSIQCLHGSIDVERVLEKDAQLRDTLVTSLSDSQALSGCIQPLLQERNFDDSSSINEHRIIPLEGFRALLKLCPDKFFTEPPLSGHTLLQQAVQLYDTNMIDYELLSSVIKELIARCPSSIFLETTFGKETMTAYRLLKSFGAGGSDKNTEWRSQTEQLIKMTCIGSREKTWEEKRKFLYCDAKSQQHFQLNLMGESAILNKDYIATIKDKSGMRFETVLDFVKLPYWKPEKATSAEGAARDLNGTQTMTKDVRSNIDPYEDIFEWLKERGIEKIFTVEVDDEGPEPHTNAAIRKSLKDFKVETWKWKKFDICSETVATAAPNAREVHLYSHGNTSVLRGWAYSPGLGKLKHLQKLVIEIYPQNESDDSDCKDFKKDFKQHIKTQCPWLDNNAIIFNNHHFQTDQGRTNRAGNLKMNGWINKLNTAADEVPKSTEWLHLLSNFIQFMSELESKCIKSSDLESQGNIPPGTKSNYNKPSVKVALLDDGCKLEVLEGEQKGQSFRLDQEEFFVGPCSHGTQMAHCILNVCPNAELYIARLDDSRKAENQKFTIASCCKALRWAIDMEVDIISMSWTFKRTGSDDHEAKFESLVHEAVSKHILLFASLPDIILAETSQFAPVSIKDVIKIGSATAFGESSKENKYAKPDFLLPGEGIQLSTGETAKGSSFSTAYASGLAASMLYCLRAHREIAQIREGEPLYKALQKAKMVDGMRGIFSRLGQNSGSPTDAAVFVQPYLSLAPDFNTSDDGIRADLEAIVNEIMPSTVLRSFYPTL